MTGSLFHGLWNNPQKNWVGNVIPLNNPTNQGFFVVAQLEFISDWCIGGPCSVPGSWESSRGNQTPLTYRTPLRNSRGPLGFMKTHWFPVIRPIKPLFLGGVRGVRGGWLNSHDSLPSHPFGEVFIGAPKNRTCLEVCWGVLWHLYWRTVWLED